MLRNLTLAFGAALVLLILVDLGKHPKAPAVPPPVQRPVESPTTATRQASAPSVVTSPSADSAAAPSATPVLDMFARLATRRRIAREGDNVFLDSLFVHTDSSIARWVDRVSLNVTLVSDTMLKRWSPALLDEVRAAMRAWDNAGSGITLKESGPSDSADITVQWTDMLADSGQIGLTTLKWTPDGAAQSALVTLALRRNTDTSVVSPVTRARVAIHEIGHALGLPHSDNPDDVMFRNSPVPAPSRRDQATLRLLYALFPGSIRVQP